MGRGARSSMWREVPRPAVRGRLCRRRPRRRRGGGAPRRPSEGDRRASAAGDGARARAGEEACGAPALGLALAGQAGLFIAFRHSPSWPKKLMPDRRFVHVTIHGRVQGVGFRYFIEKNAIERALDGWVRNREDGGVEAVFAGAGPRVEEILELCRKGPRGAKVERVDLREEEAAGLIPSSRPTGFYVMPTV